MSELRKSLLTLMQSDPTAIFAKIISVDEPKAICSASFVSNEDMVLEGVRLQAIDDENDNGFLIIPTIGSIVMLICAEKKGENAEYIVVMSSVIEKMNLKIDGEQKLEITKNLVEFNGGTKGSMVEIAKLKTQINKLETDITQLKNIFTSWVPVANDGGAALKGVITSWAAQAIAQTQITDLENDKIKQ